MGWFKSKGCELMAVPSGSEHIFNNQKKVPIVSLNHELQ